MFDRAYDFFFGDQLRKHVVLISAFFLGQVCMIPFLNNLEPSQYVAIAVAISFISTGPLALLYDKFHVVQRERTEELRRVENRPSD